MPEMTIQQAFELAVQHHQTGRLNEAESIYRQILAVEPRHADALHMLGVIAAQMGRNDVAIELIQQAIAMVPDHPDAHGNLGLALRDGGRLDEALAAFRHAIALKPDYAEAYHNLGNTLGRKGDLDGAIAACLKALSFKPDYPQALHDLGTAFKEKGQVDEAIAAFRRAIALRPDNAETHNDLGIVLYKQGCLDEAMAAYQGAIALKPVFAEAHSNLGIVFDEKGFLAESIAAHRRAAALRPDYFPAHNNLGNALREDGQLDEALAAYGRALALVPESFEIHLNMGNALKDIGQRDEALAAYRRAIELKPDLSSAHSNLLLTLHYDAELDAEAISDEHRCWSRRHEEPMRQCIRPHANDRDSERPLRIGYVSPDFRTHSVTYFLAGLLQHHDRARMEVFCYSDVIHPDAMTARMQQEAGHWRKIKGMSDSEVADRIREDRIDILVDLAGHTANNRLLVFARKPAPVQVTWLGYPNTSGLDTMDYRLTDTFADPPGSTEALHTEQLVRLPRSAWCYRPHFEDPPPANSPPVHNKGHITFGCFNAMPKINRPLLELWARILMAVPGSRLLLKNKALGESSVRQQLRTVFEQAGVDAQRLEMLGHIPDPAGHLGTYGQVDIALDTFPYHGTTTTCEALWMGVPVVTLAGKTHVSRVGVSLLSNLGHPEWIAASPEEYVKLAVEMAGDIPHLAELRSSLREKMQASPLMDAAGFARDVESAYRKMWRTWCEIPESQPCPK